METCTLNACKTCTPCDHDRPEECRGTVKCPNTGEVFTCRGTGARATA